MWISILSVFVGLVIGHIISYSINLITPYQCLERTFFQFVALFVLSMVLLVQNKLF